MRSSSRNKTMSSCGDYYPVNPILRFRSKDLKLSRSYSNSVQTGCPRPKKTSKHRPHALQDFTALIRHAFQVMTNRLNGWSFPGGNPGDITTTERTLRGTQVRSSSAIASDSPDLQSSITP